MRNSVTRVIEAAPQVIWDLLTRASAYPEWNPAVLGIEGDIAEGETIRLTSIVDPDRQFRLKVSEVEAPRHGDGSSEFRMEKVYTGLMAPLITRSIPDMTESFEMFADGLEAAAESK